MLLADIRFCEKKNTAQILAVDRTSPYPWPERVIVGDLLAEGERFFYLGAFAEYSAEYSIENSEGKLLGYAVLGDEKGSGLLMNLVVLPEYQRYGIGSQLVMAAAECAAELGCASMVLRVRQSNYAAQMLYKTLGFKTTAVRETYYSDGEAAECMSVKLPLTI